MRLAVSLAVATLLLPRPALEWQDWSGSVFERARAERRLVLLDLGAVWCHWCHVMEETTYRDPEVVALLRDHFVAVKVDQDARPDLSNRYEDYGWPATIVFDADGRELVKFRGYIPPERMRSLLRGVVEDPTPGPSVTGAAARAAEREPLPEDALRGVLESLVVERYDTRNHGWGFSHKYLEWDGVEYSLERAREGDAGAERRARETLAAQLKLVDPVWGGVYQYSDSGDWDHPHFEKIMAMQAENLRVYAQAYALWGDGSHRAAALSIHRYLTTFLRSPEGAFYTSQDADVVRGEHAGAYFALGDAERRRRGGPRVDTHLYARANAWAAHALVALSGATGEERFLEEALTAARWIVTHRALEDGGFRHDADDPAGPYMGDTVAAARAFLALYGATGEREWLDRAEGAVRFVARRFRREGEPGFVTAVVRGPQDRPSAQRDENVVLGRVANLLFHYTGRREHREVAEEVWRYLSQPHVAQSGSAAAPLLLDRELRRDPFHVTVVGPHADPVARSLRRTALTEPSLYRRVEHWDRARGPLPRADVTYPELARPAAFLCANGRCSRPAYTPDDLRAALTRSGVKGS